MTFSFLRRCAAYKATYLCRTWWLWNNQWRVRMRTQHLEWYRYKITNSTKPRHQSVAVLLAYDKNCIMKNIFFHRIDVTLTNTWWLHLDDSSSSYNRCKHLQSLLDAKRLWQPGQSFIVAGFILSLPLPDPYGSEHLIHLQGLVATQHSLRNCVDHLAALSHTGYTIRCKFGLLQTLYTSQGATTR